MAIHHTSALHTTPQVEYHIIYSSSYRVPVLYFFLHHTLGGKPSGIDTVYDLLVPKRLEAGLRDIGVIGGIGMTVS